MSKFVLSGESLYCLIDKHFRWGWSENLLDQAVASWLEPLSPGMGTWNAASRPA